MNNQERISRSEFLKRSSLGLCALFVGLNEKVFAGSAPAKALPEPGEHLYNWGQAWHPESPKRLSDITHHLAQMGLSGQHGRNMPTVDWEFPEGRDEKLSNNRKYGYAALSVARNAPLRILPGELIVGSATLREAAQHRIPALNMGSVSHTTVGFAKVLHQGYKGLRAEIDERLSRGGLDSHGTDLLESMLMTLDAAALWQQRNIALLKEMKGNAPDSERRFYQNIIDTLENVPENPPRNFREAVQSLWSLYAFHRLILPGMEVFSTEDLPELIVNHKIMPLNQSRYILMEFAFDEDPEFADSILKRVEEVGARPVIAHAERYEFIQDYPQIAYRWFRKGYVIQANKGSFLGRFGGGPKRAADSLLRHNLISVIASDAHSPLQRTPYMLDAYEELSREYSENHLDVLFQYNPARICDNREILRLEPVPYSGRQQLY